MNPKICPVCEQSYIYIYLVQELQIKIFVCDECYSIWLNKENINFENALDLSEFMTNNGIIFSWDNNICKEILYENG